MEVTGVLLSVVGVFAECVRGYQVLVSVRSFSGDVATLFWRLKTQQLRLDIWGRHVGLPEQDLDSGSWNQMRPGARAQLQPQLSSAMLKFTEGVLQRICEILENAQALNNRYGLGVAPGDDITVTAQKLEHSSRLKLPAAKLRWALSDRNAFEKLIGDLKDLNDGLYTTLALRAYQQAQYTLANEMPLATDSIEELSQIREVSDENDTLQAVASLRQLVIETSAVNSSRFDVQQLEIPFDSVKMISTSPEESMRRLCVIHQYKEKYAIVEWKHYHAHPDEHDAAGRATRRMERLIRLLNQKPKPRELRTLDCVGYINDLKSHSIGLLLSFPAAMEISPRTTQIETQPDITCPWIDLHALMRQHQGLPLLEHRFALALALTKSIMQLHSTGWLHKGFRSSNVIFIRSRPQPPAASSSRRQDSNGDIDITQPIVIGFEYARPNQNAEHSDQLLPSTLITPYLHPEYHESSFRLTSSASKRRYTTNYDMYSLGCVLLEIGIWRRLGEYWKGEYESMPLEEWRARLLRRLVPELGGRCGSVYTRVVRDLLSRAEDDGVPHLTNFEIQQSLESLVV